MAYIEEYFGKFGKYQRIASVLYLDGKPVPIRLDRDDDMKEVVTKFELAIAELGFSRTPDTGIYTFQDQPTFDPGLCGACFLQNNIVMKVSLMLHVGERESQNYPASCLAQYRQLIGWSLKNYIAAYPSFSGTSHVRILNYDGVWELFGKSMAAHARRNPMLADALKQQCPNLVEVANMISAANCSDHEKEQALVLFGLKEPACISPVPNEN